jgi:hypothetical protein
LDTKDAILELRRLAEDYLKIESSDPRERLSLKNESAKQMFDHATTNSISKESLRSEILKDFNEGLVLTLANLVLTSPEEADAGRLLSIADPVKRWHVRYRIVQAFAELFNKGYAQSIDYRKIGAVLRHYEESADPPLIKQIRATRTLIQRRIHQED